MPRWPERTDLERLMEKTREELDCVLYTGALSKDGYGRFRIKVNGKWTVKNAHLVSWELQIGPVPEGLVLRHACDTRNCINIKHLEPGTPWENNQDIIKRHRGRNQYGPWVGKSAVADGTDDCPF